MNKKESFVNTLDLNQQKKAYDEVLAACIRNIKDSKGRTTIVAGLQILHKYFDSHNPILDINASVPEQNDWTPLMFSTYYSKYEESKVLVSLGANLNYKTSKNLTFLHLASNQGSIGLCDFYIKKGILIDSQDSSGITPLMMACESGNLDVVKFLLNHKANYMLKDKEQKTCIDYCHKNNHEHIIKYLNFFYLNQSLDKKDVKKPIVKV